MAETDHKYLNELDPVTIFQGDDEIYVARDQGTDPDREDRKTLYDVLRTQILAGHTHVEDEITDLDRVRWSYPYSLGASYKLNDMVRDGDWTMIANKDTTERAAPQTAGVPSFALPESPVWTEQASVSSIHSGHKYVVNDYGYLSILRAWVPEVNASTTYRFIILEVTDPDNPTYRSIEQSDLTEAGWTTLEASSVLVSPGQEFIFYIDALNSGSDSQVTGGWVYGGQDNVNQPLTAQWNANNGNSILRIDKTDSDTVDRATELLGIIAGSTVQYVETATPGNSRTYLVTGTPVDQGTYIEFPVSLESTGGTGLLGAEQTTMTATVPVPQSTKFVELATHWSANPTSWATVTGFLEYDGVAEPGHEDSAFGVDTQFQLLIASDDWNVVALSSGGGGGGGGGGDLTPHALDYHSDVAAPAPLDGEGLWFNGVDWVNRSTIIERVAPGRVDPDRQIYIASNGNPATPWLSLALGIQNADQLKPTGLTGGSGVTCFASGFKVWDANVNGALMGGVGNSWMLLSQVAASLSNPTLIPNDDHDGIGIGGNGIDSLSLIANNDEILTVTYDPNGSRVSVKSGGVTAFTFDVEGLHAGNTSGPLIKNESPGSLTNPTICPRKDQPTTGLSVSGTGDQMGINILGATGARFIRDTANSTTTLGFTNVAGTPATTSNIGQIYVKSGNLYYKSPTGAETKIT